MSARQTVDGRFEVTNISQLIFLNKDTIRAPSDLARVKDWLNNDFRIYDLFKVIKSDK